MKFSYLSVLTGLLLAAGVSACTDDEATPQEEFFVKAQKDGQAWNKGGRGVYVTDKGVNVTDEGHFLIYSPDTIPYTSAEVVSLRFSLPYGQPLASARPLAAEWKVLVGGDAASNSYETDSTSLPRITVTRLDTVQKIVEGRFEAILRRNKHWTNQVEEMRFTQGSFRVRYQEVP